MIDQPEILRDVHAEYFNVGASVATTNTYPVLHDRLVRAGLQDQIETLWDAGGQKRAILHATPMVAAELQGSIGPLGCLIPPGYLSVGLPRPKSFIGMLSQRCRPMWMYC
jgi:homocysteine S-methyltransferase